MSKHTHKHSCECEHENVKFCKQCKVVHCLDCNMEWGGYKVYWYYGYPYNQQFTYTNSTGDYISQGTTVTCNHSH